MNSINFDKLFQEICAYSLYDLVSRETQLKPAGTNQWVGKSPFRQEKHPSFSVGYKNNSWCWYDFTTGEGGNIFSYLKAKYQLIKNIDIANFLGIEIPLLDNNEESGYKKTNKKNLLTPQINWELKEKNEHQRLIKNLKQTVKKDNLKNNNNIIVDIKHNNISLTEVTTKTEWDYPSVQVTVKRKKINGQKKHLTNDVTITPQKHKDDDVKKWRYKIETKYSGTIKTSYLYSKDEVRNTYNLPDFNPDIYNRENIQNLPYLVFTEGESDCDAAYASRLNAAAMPSPNLDEQIKLLKNIKDNYDAIKFIIILADNDFTGIKKALTTLKACEKVGFGAIALNLYNKELITSHIPEESLINAKKEGQKWINDGQGYDFRDYVNSLFLVKNTENIFNHLKELFLVKRLEFIKDLSKENEFDYLWYQPQLEDYQLNIYRINLFSTNKNQLLKKLKEVDTIEFVLQGKDILTGEQCRFVFGFKKYLEKLGKEIIFSLNGNSIDFKKLCAIAFEMQRIHNYYEYTSQINLNVQYLNGQVLENALSNSKLEGKLIAIKSGLGTNKTGSIGELINCHKELKNRGTLQLSDINKLLTQTVERYNKLDKTFHHLHFDQAHDLIGDDQSNIACCFQSLLNFKEYEIAEKVIIIDENMSVIFSLLDGGTFPNSILQQLIKQQLEMVLRSCYCVFILDGNLSNKNVDLMASMCQKELIKIENIVPEKKNYKIQLAKDWDGCVAQAIDDCQAGKRITICADSQSELRRIYKLCLSKYNFPIDSIMIGDKNSTKEECPVELLENPSQFFVDHPEVRMFLYSPSMGRGFDIQGDIFDIQYGYFCGVLSVDQIDQMPFRIRTDNIERILFVENKIGALRKVNKYTDNQKLVLANQILEALDLINKKELETDFKTIVEKFSDESLFRYGLELDKFNEKSGESLQFSFYAFGLLKGYQMEIKDISNKKGKEIKDAKDNLKIESKEAEEKLFNESVFNVLNFENITKNIAEIKNDIAEIECKLKEGDLFLSEERKKQLTEEKESLEEQLTEEGLKFAKTQQKINKIDKKFPTITSTNSFKKKEFVEILSDDFTSNQLSIDLTRIYYLRQERIPTEIIEKQLYLFLKSERKYGNAWINDLNTEVLLIKLFKEMKVLDIIEKYYWESGEFLDESSEEFLAVSNLWDSNLLGDRPKNKIKQLRKVLDYIGYDICSIYQDRKGIRKYIIVPSLLKNSLLSNNVKELKDKLAKDYADYRDFYNNFIDSLAIKISQRKVYRTHWNDLNTINLVEDIGSDESLLDTRSDFYYKKIESACLINEQPVTYKEAIRHCNQRIELFKDSQQFSIDGINYERFNFKDNSSVTIAESVAADFWFDFDLV